MYFVKIDTFCFTSFVFVSAVYKLLRNLKLTCFNFASFLELRQNVKSVNGTRSQGKCDYLGQFAFPLNSFSMIFSIADYTVNGTMALTTIVY